MSPSAMDVASTDAARAASGPPATRHDDASQSALAVAGFRWLASTADDKADERTDAGLCDDPWAGPLAGRRGRDMARRLHEESPATARLVALRTAHYDRQVRHHLGALDVRQVVILGAGLDSRAARFASAGARFFEVDRASGHELKQRRMEAVADYPRDAARHLICDLEAEDPLPALADAGFDAGRPSFWLLEGLCCYLPEAAVRRLLGSIAATCEAGCRVVFDLVHPGAEAGNGERSQVEDLLWLADRLRRREPIRWLSADPATLLHEAGYAYVRSLPFHHLALSVTGDLRHGSELRHHSIVHATTTSLPQAHVRW